MTEPLTFRHAALHFAKYAGEVCTIAERRDHETDPRELARAREEAAVFLARRPNDIFVVGRALIAGLREAYPNLPMPARKCGWNEPRPSRGWTWFCGVTARWWTISAANTEGDVPTFCPGCGGSTA